MARCEIKEVKGELKPVKCLEETCTEQHYKSFSAANTAIKNGSHTKGSSVTQDGSSSSNSGGTAGKFHVNPKTLDTGECNATIKCPFGGDLHFATQAKAQAHAEKMGGPQISAITKADQQLSDARNVLNEDRDEVQSRVDKTLEELLAKNPSIKSGYVHKVPTRQFYKYSEDSSGNAEDLRSLLARNEINSKRHGVYVARLQATFEHLKAKAFEAIAKSKGESFDKASLARLEKLELSDTINTEIQVVAPRAFGECQKPKEHQRMNDPANGVLKCPCYTYVDELYAHDPAKDFSLPYAEMSSFAQQKLSNDRNYIFRAIGTIIRKDYGADSGFQVDEEYIRDTELASALVKLRNEINKEAEALGVPNKKAYRAAEKEQIAQALANFRQERVALYRRDSLSLRMAMEQAAEWGEELPCTATANNVNGAWTADTNSYPQEQNYAASKCAPCPVLNECKKIALKYPEMDNVWGGITKKERDKGMKKQFGSNDPFQWGKNTPDELTHESPAGLLGVAN